MVYQYTLEHFFLDTQMLCNRVLQVQRFNTVLYTRPRGGLMPGVLISHRCEVPLIVHQHELPMNNRVIIIDEIIDNGKTMDELTHEVLAASCTVIERLALVCRERSYPFPYRAARFIGREEADWVKFWWE